MWQILVPWLGSSAVIWCLSAQSTEMFYKKDVGLLKQISFFYWTFYPLVHAFCNLWCNVNFNSFRVLSSAVRFLWIKILAVGCIIATGAHRSILICQKIAWKLSQPMRPGRQDSGQKNDKNVVLPAVIMVIKVALYNNGTNKVLHATSRSRERLEGVYRGWTKP